MGWQDDPVVSTAQPSWMNDPIVGQPSPTPQDPGILANAARALRMGLPFGNQFVAGEKTLAGMLPGGSGQSYGQNLADVNAADARLQQEHPIIADLGQGTGAAIGALAVPGAALGEGAQGLGVIGRATRGGLAGAGLGAVQGAGAPGSDIRNIPQTEEGAIGGGYTGFGLGAAFPALGAGIGSLVSRGTVDPARNALVESLQSVGIKPTAGQITGNQGLRKLEASISDIPFGGGGAEPVRQANAAAFTKAILAKAGFPEVADASQESLNAAHEALGKQFDELGARNAITPDPQLHAEMDAAVNGYHMLTGSPAPGVSKVVDMIKGEAPNAPETITGATISAGGKVFDAPNHILAMDKAEGEIGRDALLDARPVDGFRTSAGRVVSRDEAAQIAAMSEQQPLSPPGMRAEARTITDAAPRVIPGEEYNNLRSQLGKMAQKARVEDPAQAEAYRGIQDALDSAMERSITANNPADIGAFQEARQKYRNLLPIEQARGSAGEDAASGIISPQQMRTALAAGGNRRSYARGIGDLAPLTNAGNAILTNFPQSGTAPRTMMAHALQAAGGLAGGLGGATGGVEGAGLGATAGALALPALAGRAIMSGPGQALLSRALAKRLPAAEIQRPLSRAAMAAALGANADLQARRNQATQP
jgi:hypothetical protein